MTKRMIKDPYFEMYSKGGNVSKRLEGKGNLSEKKELLKLADAEKERFDFETGLIQTLKEKFMEEREGNETFSDWLKSKPKSYFKIIPLQLAEGGKVIDLQSYLKQKQKPRIKKLNLDSVAIGKSLSELTEAERAAVNKLLRLTFGKGD